ncbi:hypothetical protein KR032_011802 [Drosophila birchii]|nr:hypothetical protein KR032_011802 [Drosophila birchii]
MHVDLAIVKQELDIDDTRIKLEPVDELSDGRTVPISWAGETWKTIAAEDSEMLRTSVSGCSQDDRISVVRKGGSGSQQQGSKPFECRICHFLLHKHLDISEHMVAHQINRHFCKFGCGAWFESLEKILEHEYRQHSQPGLVLCCRICDFVAKDADRLASHMLNHVYVYRFVCAICRHHFDSIDKIKRHRKHSSQICGQVGYIDEVSTKAELVAVSAASGQALCDFKIKEEPLELEDEEMAQTPAEIVKVEPKNAEVHEIKIKEDPETVNSTFWSTIPNPLRSKLRLPAIKTKNEQIKPKSIANEILLSEGNQRNTLKLPSDKIKTLPKEKPPQTNTANILKALPTNCMVIKLPPNTKIIKMAGQAAPAAQNNSSIYVQSDPKMSMPKTITIPQAITVSRIKTEEAKPILPVVGATPRNPSMIQDAFNKAESDPKSIQIISEFRDQIRSIEKDLPLPGTVLQSTNTRSNYPPVWAKTAASENAPKHLQLLLNSLTDILIKELRITYPHYGFLWKCPLCHRSYDQNYAIRMHLISIHNMSQEQLNYIKVILMPYKLLSHVAQPLESIHPEPNSLSEEKAENIATLLHDALVTTPPIISDKDVLPPKHTKPEKPRKTSKQRKASTVKCTDFKCTECSKTFTTLGALRIHKTIHTGEMPYKCDYCEKRFRTQGQVRVHHRRHTGEKPFKCKVCSLSFTHRETLISHLSRHIGMKRYKCYGCDKYFVVISGLRAHRRLRPDTCGKVKFTARAHGPRVRVVRGEVVFEPHPEHNGYLRSEDPINILTEVAQTSDVAAAKPPEGLN